MNHKQSMAEIIKVFCEQHGVEVPDDLDQIVQEFSGATDSLDDTIGTKMHRWIQNLSPEATAGLREISESLAAELDET